MDDFQWLPNLIWKHGNERPDAPAVTVDGVTWDWDTLAGRMEAVAALLMGLGVRPGHTVAACGASSLDYASLWLGVLRAGAVMVPLPPSATPEQIAAMVADCGARHFFADAPVREALADVPLTVEVHALDELEQTVGWGVCENVDVTPKAGFNIIYSSGTTGVPKGIVHSHAMRWLQVRSKDALGYDASAVTLLATPLYSNTTLVSFLPALAGGGHVVLMPKFDAAGYVALAARVRATHTMLVPVQYRRIMALPDFDAHDLSSFRMKFCTSAPFPAALKAEVLRRWPGGLIEYYGMTEGGGGTVLVAHEHPDKLHTVGHVIPGHELRVIGEDGAFLPAGEVGELVGRSAATMTGYANRPEATRAAQWVDPDGGVWIRTGDVGRLDADGYLQLMDRAKDMIVSGGFNVYPSDIEAVLAQDPDVSDCAVVGVPSEEWGETPLAVVVARAPTDGEALRARVNAKLGKTQRLSAVWFVDELPRSAIGKVLKRELRDAWARRGARPGQAT